MTLSSNEKIALKHYNPLGEKFKDSIVTILVIIS